MRVPFREAPVEAEAAEVAVAVAMEAEEEGMVAEGEEAVVVMVAVAVAVVVEDMAVVGMVAAEDTVAATMEEAAAAEMRVTSVVRLGTWQGNATRVVAAAGEGIVAEEVAVVVVEVEVVATTAGRKGTSPVIAPAQTGRLRALSKRVNVCPFTFTSILCYFYFFMLVFVNGVNCELHYYDACLWVDFLVYLVIWSPFF